MLTLTNEAVEVIRDLEVNLSPHAGMRLAARPGEAADLDLGFANRPWPGDQVIEEVGVRLFIDQNTAIILADSALDALIDERGEVAFFLTAQPPPCPPGQDFVG